MDLIKYDMTDIWAVAGDVVAPDTAKIRSGWGVEVVPRQWWNWFENRQDNNIAYMLQKGFPEWDATTEYIINKSYVQRSGIVYRATATSTNSDPIALTSWVKAFVDSTPYLEKIKGLAVTPGTVPFIDAGGNAVLNPIGATGSALLATQNAADARTIISAQQANSNLTALSGVSPVANGLPYFTGTTTMGITTLTSFGRSLIDDNDAVAARATLGLTATAITDLQIGPIDRTPGRVTRVGSFGMGAYLDLRGSIYATGTPADVVALGTMFGLVDGGTAGLAIPGLTGIWYGTLQVNAQWQDTSAISSTSRTFITTNGRTFTQTAASATTWGAWNEAWNTTNLVKTANNLDSTVGRMLQVGDFGLGQNAVIITDPDTVYRASGFYDVSPTTTWASNPVAGGWTRIFHQSHGNTAGYATQIATGNFAVSMASPRMFVRYCVSGTWSAFVEFYHSGNTSAIVAQVQAGIQPQLDAKVNKAGDTMGNLVINNGGTQSLLRVTSSGSPKMELLKTGQVAGMWYVNSGNNIAWASTAGDGVPVTDLIYWSSSTGNVTFVGTGSFQGALSTSGLLTAASMQVNGNGTISGTMLCTNATVNNTLTVLASANIAGGPAGGVNINSGIVNIYPGSNTQASNNHVWFRNTDGGTRAIIYAQNGNTLTLQAGGVVGANFYASGTASFNAISVTGLSSSGRVTGSDCVFVGNVYSGNGVSFLATDGNVYGGAWGGYLSTYLGNNMITPANLRGNLANIRAGELGSYALLQHPGGANIGPNGSVAGTDMSWATAAGGFDERVGSGTWVVMGRISTGNKPVATTLCMRYA